ncbi:MAG: hypothetical protein AABW92_00455 [Nanoarchaeota archaeon]
MSSNHPSKKPSWDNHETLDDLILTRHKLTERTKSFLRGIHGEAYAEIVKLLKKDYDGISPAEIADHSKKKEIIEKLRTKIDDILSYKNDIHPLNQYLNKGEIEKDDFIKKLVNDIFTPHKDTILNSLGERDFREIFEDSTNKHYRSLEEKSQQYVFTGFNPVDEAHRDAAAKYLSKIKGKKVTSEDIAEKTDKHLADIYRNVLSKYS